MARQDEDLDDFGRFAEPALMILISLADGPKHGYAMTDDIEQVAGVRFGPGTLYGAITRLEGRGLIQRMDSDDRRNPYRLTAYATVVGSLPGPTLSPATFGSATAILWSCQSRRSGPTSPT